MNGTLWDRRKFRLLNIVDDYNREVLHIEADTSLSTARLIRCLEYLKEFRRLPQIIRVDNGPELSHHNLIYGAGNIRLHYYLYNQASLCKTDCRTL